MIDAPKTVINSVTGISIKTDLDAGKPDIAACEQQRRRPACASTQSKQRLGYSLYWKGRDSPCCICEISIFWLVCVAEQIGLNHTNGKRKPRRQGFSHLDTYLSNKTRYS